MEKIKDIKTNWNLKLLIQNENKNFFEENRKEAVEANYKFINKWKDRKDYLENPLVLREALDEYENIARCYGSTGNEGVYYVLAASLNQTDPEIRAKLNKIKDIEIKIANDIQFFTHRISKIPLEKQNKFLENEKLKVYKHFLETLFKEAKFILSEEEEKILNLKNSTSYGNWVRMLSSLLSKEETVVIDESGKKVKKNFSDLFNLIRSTDKRVRDAAAKAINTILNKYADIAENEINSVLEDKKVDDELRNILRSDFARHISDDIDSEVVDTLLKTVSQRFDQAHRYYRLKAKLLGVKKLKYHERNIEYGSINKKFSYDEALNLVRKTFKNLDEEFARIVKSFALNGQIDVYPKKGKSGGAFSAGFRITLPNYILLNFGNKLNDVTTIAHEFGHAINDELIKTKQNALNADTPLSTAEVASTFMEDFVLEEILKTADDQTKLSIMTAKLDDCISTIHRQSACYLFEQELHKTFREKGYLSKELIGRLFQKHMKAYMGDYVEQSKGAENWWIYWGHIRSFFYVYSYASGLLISKSLQSSVKKDPAFIKKVKEFLSAGSSASPKEIFNNLGIDITDERFWSKGLDEIEILLAETEKLAKKLNKI